MWRDGVAAAMPPGYGARGGGASAVGAAAVLPCARMKGVEIWCWRLGKLVIRFLVRI